MSPIQYPRALKHHHIIHVTNVITIIVMTIFISMLMDAWQGRRHEDSKGGGGGVGAN